MNQLDENVKPHGPWIIYNPDGVKICMYNYEHGIKHGLWENYYSNGQLQWKGEHKNGKDLGLWYESRYAK